MDFDAVSTRFLIRVYEKVLSISKFLRSKIMKSLSVKDSNYGKTILVTGVTGIIEGNLIRNLKRIGNLKAILLPSMGYVYNLWGNHVHYLKWSRYLREKVKEIHEKLVLHKPAKHHQIKWALKVCKYWAAVTITKWIW
jgi:hypothetical protein